MNKQDDPGDENDFIRKDAEEVIEEFARRHPDRVHTFQKNDAEGGSEVSSVIGKSEEEIKEIINKYSPRPYRNHALDKMIENRVELRLTIEHLHRKLILIKNTIGLEYIDVEMMVDDARKYLEKIQSLTGV